MPFQNEPGCLPCQPDMTPCSTDNIGPAHSYSSTPCNPDMNASYKVEDYLLAMQGRLLPMHRTFMKAFPTITQFMFDYYEQPDPNSPAGMTKLTLKNIPNIQYGSYQEGNFITWGEWNFKPTDFYVRADVAVAALVIPVGDLALTPTLGADYTQGGQGKLSVGDTVLIYRNDPAVPEDCCNQLIQKTIVAIDPIANTITIEGATGFTFKEGDKIKRMYAGRNDGEAITNSFGIIPNTAKRSYIQHFGYKVQFQKGELNKAYASENGVKDFITNRMYHGNLNMLREVAFSFYRGRNRGNVYGSGVSATQKGETQGLITGILDSNTRLPELELIRSMHNLTTDDDRVRHILNSILKVQNSGFVQQGQVVTMLCNEQALTSLLQMHQAWNRFAGVTVNKNENINKDFQFPIINTPNGRVEWMQCNILSEMYQDEGVIIYGVKDNMMVKARENQTVSLPGGSVEKASLGFNFIDITQPGQPGVGHERRVYDIFTEFTNIVVGLDQGAWRMDVGLLPC